MSKERYEIRGKIGQGGVGAVYQAYDTQLNRDVAIKRVLADGGYEDQDEATKHLLKEATALSSVQHPHIVTVYDAGIDADGPYVVMELIDGRTLDEMVERGTLTWDDLREVALQTQEALIAAQDLDLVHRDLKPSNVMVCWLPSGKFQVKIVDFGLAKFSAAPSLQTIDHGDAVFGSIFFMAPEQFERTPLDKRTDMYAMGCLYYYALTGEYPFTGDTAAEVMASHLQHHVKHLSEVRPDIPQWGADWIMWQIERYMEDRPATAREALERFLILDKQSTQPVTMTSPDSQPPTPAKAKFLFPSETPPVDQTQPAEPTVPVEATGVPVQPTPAAPAQQVQTVVPTPVAPVQPAQPTPQEPISLQAPQEAPEPVQPKTAPQPITPPGADLSPHTKVQNINIEPTPGTAPQPVTVPQPAVVPVAVPEPPAQPIQASIPSPPAPPAQPAPPAPPTQPAVPSVVPATTPLAVASAVIPQAPEPPAAITPLPESAKKTMPTGAKWAIIGMLALVVIVTAIVMLSLNSDRKQTEMVNAVMKQAKALNDEGKLQDGIELTEEELKGTLMRATSMAETKHRAIILKTLAYTKAKGSYNPDQVILTHITTARCPESIRASIFKTVMSRRKNVANIPALLEFAKNTTENSAATEAINAARYSAEGQPADEFINDFLTLINDTESATVRSAAERAAASIIADSKNKDDFTAPIYGSYQTAVNDSAKFVMLRLLGVTGGEKAIEAVTSALQSDKLPLQSAAIAALSQWVDDSQIEVLIEFIAQCENKKVRQKAFTAAYSFLRLDRKRDTDDLEDYWKSFAGTAQSQSEKLQIIRGMANQKDEWAISILEYFIDDKSKDDLVIDKAEQAKDHLERLLREQSSGSDDE